ncbi:MAG: two-component sensor histidine kinase [Archangium gephyra]|uniref:histidine kinase n=1 Tax=Archangium gephyra TaxID=48 RepID=A0A2W5T4V4_9BACT|nr:MAG: two-component sensor histidine kinase [Archangium gephyra]
MKRWWLPVVMLVAASVEVAVRDDLPSRAGAWAFALAIAGALAFRRSHPLGATAFAFSLATATTLVQHHFELPELGPTSGVGILALPYALTRWASRRDVSIGAAFVVMTWVVSLLSGEMQRREDIVGSAVVLILPGTIGAVVRFRNEAQQRGLEQARSLERERLARELHDSVAHHVTAITLQAQAARAVIDTRPSDAKHALQAIEEEAKRTLTELRGIVGALRDDEAALSPAGGIAELRALSSTLVHVEVGAVGALSPMLERALFRIAQEAVTNSIKHARNATKVHVRLSAERDVELTVSDDGEPGARRGAGFGLIGMAERVALLGGTFEAGPASERGWRVHAVIPR